ncbi:Telomerase reverse transcriptase [Cytospora paraplurivora]|uniref:Telomerase reverse transcriptase n=1 Tax=Cytospora paraplurivora TaxID=2898453 RepID=A0AAN9U6J5_9PEZI
MPRRKRAKYASSGGGAPEGPPAKQPKTGADGMLQSADVVKHALLPQYYPKIRTLRQYVLDKLPPTSKVRRRKIAAVGNAQPDAVRAAQGPKEDSEKFRNVLAELLDATLVCTHVLPQEEEKAQSDSLLQQWMDYSQRGDESHVTLSGGIASAIHFQSEKLGPTRQGVATSIQGVYSLYLNERVAAIKREPWPQLLVLLGKSGESMMIDLLLESSIFLRVDAGQGNYYQLSDALNRFPLRRLNKESNDTEGGNQPKGVNSTLRVLMYMFPRQFGLHNAFTSHVDQTQTAQKFQDYTFREEEISHKFGRFEGCNEVLDVRVPKRLRGKPEHLVQRLQTLHTRNANRHCSSFKAPFNGKLSGDVRRGRKKPRQTNSGAGTLKYTSLIDLAIPVSKVSAFCQAALAKIIPREFWGHDEVQAHNWRIFLRKVDNFIRLRRFETISLHEVIQGFKIIEIEWLEPPGLKHRKCSQTDFRKRSEIFQEFLYYIFDSLVIPLIRSNFYVTESNVHRYGLYFFRHDVWKHITEPAMAELKAKMFEEVKVDEALRIRDSRRLGYNLGFSHIRLLPKKTSIRPIMNLRRRAFMANGKKTLGQSINAILGPVYNMLKLEKDLDASRLGSAIDSVGAIYERISGFKQWLGQDHGPLYFAKVDVQAAFDTIPQAAIIALMRSVPSHSGYEIVKHFEVRHNDNGVLTGSKVMKRWQSSAKPAHDNTTFLQMLKRQLALGKKNAVYVDSIFRKSHSARDLLALMESHIQQNLVKIGKKYYRQKNGIPQGSVISSLLCNYFYADLESKKLQFLQAEDCVLLRFVDDFLLVTTDKSKASKFVAIMQQGMPEYGVTVGPSKTLVNFDMAVNGSPVPKVKEGSHDFPYCGRQIDCRTLEITKDRGEALTSAMRDATISKSLTVEFSRHPGQNFRRKVIYSFKIQSHAMFFDTRHNKIATVLRNLQGAFVETATRVWAYERRLPRGKQPGPRLIIDTISELADVAYSLLTSPARKMKNPGYECNVTKSQVRWSALSAFRVVLGKKQARFGEVLGWVDEEMAKLRANKVS